MIVIAPVIAINISGTIVGCDYDIEVAVPVQIRIGGAPSNNGAAQVRTYVASNI